MNISKKLLDNLIGELKSPEELYGKGGLIESLTRAITERFLSTLNNLPLIRYTVMGM